jgi:hypothetical protein
LASALQNRGETPPSGPARRRCRRSRLRHQRESLLFGAQKLTLEWTQLSNGARALVFDAETWASFEKAAQAQGKTPQQLISTAVAGSLGTVMMDNYTLIAG